MLRRELKSCNGLQVGWGAIAGGTLLALLHRDAADRCFWDKFLAPPHRVPPVYDDPPPARGGMTSSQPSTTTGSSPTTRGKRSGEKRSVGTTDAVFLPACRNSGTRLARVGTTSGSAVSSPGHRPPTSHTPATSVESVTRCPPPHRRAPTGARSAPRWSRAPGLNHTRKKWRCTGASRTRKPHRTATRAPRLPPTCGSTCTCGTPGPSRTCRTCWHPDPRPMPRLAEPTAPCPAEGGTGRSTPGPAADRRRRPSGAWWRMP